MCKWPHGASNPGALSQSLNCSRKRSRINKAVDKEIALKSPLNLNVYMIYSIQESPQQSPRQSPLQSPHLRVASATNNHRGALGLMTRANNIYFNFSSFNFNLQPFIYFHLFEFCFLHLFSAKTSAENRNYSGLVWRKHSAADAGEPSAAHVWFPCSHAEHAAGQLHLSHHCDYPHFSASSLVRVKKQT